MEIVEGEGGGDGHLFWIMVLVGVGLDSSGDSCWELVLVGLDWGGGGWELVLGRVRVGVCGGLGVGVGLNSWGEELWLLYSKLLIRACKAFPKGSV